MNLGQVGVWNVGLRSDDHATAGDRAEAAAELEELGYGAIWLGSSPGLEHAAPLLAATSRIVVATGILSIWAYEAADVARQQADLDAEHPGRFLLGLGVSHAGRAARYHKPYSSMAGYLDALDAAGAPVSRRVLAALGPKMLKLAADRTAGAHPYLVTPEHTMRARQVLGRGPLLAPEVKVILETDPARARAVAREHLAVYLELPSYLNNLLRLGYAEEDFRDGGSDRLVDAVVAWGDREALRRRVAEHRDAGADHICIQVLGGGRTHLPRKEWRELAEALDLT